MNIEKAMEDQAQIDMESAVSIREILSAWLDGELTDSEARSLWCQINNNDHLRDDFCCYCLVRFVRNRNQRPDLWAKIRVCLDA